MAEPSVCILCSYISTNVDQTHLAREKARADADYYKAQKEAESNKVKV